MTVGRVIPNVTPDNLNDAMEIDHVIRVWPGRVVTDAPGVYAPGVSNLGEDVEQPWSLMTGYTGQYSYSGPCMHASEFIGGRMAVDILDQPGWYVAVVAEADRCSEPGCEDCDPYGYATSNGESRCPFDCDLCGSEEPAGWVVAYVEAECPGHELLAGDHMGEAVTCNTSCCTFPRPTLYEPIDKAAILSRRVDTL